MSIRMLRKGDKKASTRMMSKIYLFSSQIFIRAKFNGCGVKNNII